MVTVATRELSMLLQTTSKNNNTNKKKTETALAYLAMAEGAISSRFSMLHSSKNSKMGAG